MMKMISQSLPVLLLYRDPPQLLPGNQIRKMHIGFAKVYSSPSQHTDDIMQKVQYLFDRRKRKYIVLYYTESRERK